MATLLQALTKSGLVAKAQADEVERERQEVERRREAEEIERLVAKKAAKARPVPSSGDQGEYQANADTGRRDPV
jgi:hypothetical protein